jgi:hypothetical protein
MRSYVSLDSLSSFFTPIRCFPHEGFKTVFQSGIVLNDPLTMCGMFVCFEQQFTLGTGPVHHVTVPHPQSFISVNVATLGISLVFQAIKPERSVCQTSQTSAT